MNLKQFGIVETLERLLIESESWKKDFHFGLKLIPWLGDLPQIFTLVNNKQKQKHWNVNKTIGNKSVQLKNATVIISNAEKRCKNHKLCNIDDFKASFVLYDNNSFTRYHSNQCFSILRHKFIVFAYISIETRLRHETGLTGFNKSLN